MLHGLCLCFCLTARAWIKGTLEYHSLEKTRPCSPGHQPAKFLKVQNTLYFLNNSLIYDIHSEVVFLSMAQGLSLCMPYRYFTINFNLPLFSLCGQCDSFLFFLLWFKVYSIALFLFSLRWNVSHKKVFIYYISSITASQPLGCLFTYQENNHKVRGLNRLSSSCAPSWSQRIAMSLPSLGALKASFGNGRWKQLSFMLIEANIGWRASHFIDTIPHLQTSSHSLLGRHWVLTNVPNTHEINDNISRWCWGNRVSVE